MALPKYRVAKGLPDGREKVAYTSGTAVTAGYLVQLSADGFVDNVGTTTVAKALGVALNSTTGAGEEVIVATAQPGVVFSAVNKTGGSYTAALVGDLQQADEDGVDVGTATTPLVTIVGIDLTDDPGTGASRVLCHIDPAKSQAPGGSATPT